MAVARKLLQHAAVNVHYTRVCNFTCKFCFHAAKTSDVLPLPRLFQILAEVRSAGCDKINFAGGEPMLPAYQPTTGALVKFAKAELGFSSVSLISNGSHVNPAWFERYGEFLDIYGVSCDTQDPAINALHGRIMVAGARRRAADGTALDKVRRLRDLARKHGMRFKINTVVTALNHTENMSPVLNELVPDRWKIFQVLAIDGENTGAARPRRKDVTPLQIDRATFEAYVARNTAGLRPELRHIVKPEDNLTMQKSYIIIDEHGCFLDTSSGGKTPTASILDVGVDAAAAQLLASEGGGFDRELFYARGGYYPEAWHADRSRPHAAPICGSTGV